jgi:succinate dehydrogenase hydrophobic anchor subunit
VCGLCLVAAACAVARLRMSMSKSRAAALSFAVPGALVLVPAAWLVARGDAVALVPLVTIAVLCFCAAALFTPTAATRFAAFERQFWAHVNRGG